MSIGALIRKYRRENSLTQVELAQKIKKSSQVISDWERGHTKGLTAEDLRNLAAVFAVSEEELRPDLSTEEGGEEGQSDFWWARSRNNLVYLRKANAYSQKELAAVVGVTRSAYANYENGAREPGMKILVRLADFYGISLDELVGHEPTGEVCLPLSEDRKFMERYRRLSSAGKLRLQNQVQFELSLEEGERKRRQ